MTSFIDWTRVEEKLSEEQAVVFVELTDHEKVVDRWLEAAETKPTRTFWNRNYVGTGSDRHLDEMEKAIAERRRRRVERAGR